MTSKDQYKQALNYSLRLLLRRDRTRMELENKLIEKGYDKEICCSVIKQVIAWGYLDDKKYANNFILLGMNNGKGKNKLYYALLTKGIAKDLARETIDSMFSEEIEYQQLNEVATKKITNLLKRNPPEAIYYKLFRFLVSRGFSAHTVKSWIEANLQAFLDNIANKL